MYVHAYQSYVWNAIVSERIRTYGSDKPIPGDLVFESETEDVLAGIDSGADPLDGDVLSAENEQGMSAALSQSSMSDRFSLDIDLSAKSSKQFRKPWEPPRMRALTADDVDKHTIFDVVMPLPGKDVAYPGGQLGERYKEFLKMDGLDPDNFVRKQK
jgi:tRNA pseudouridine13 synthase